VDSLDGKEIKMLEKQVVVDKIEVIEVGVVQVRTATRIVEDGNVISTSYHRHTVSPGQDYSQEDARVQAICAATHTPEVVSAYQAMLTEQANRV
jgi:hypothetical protein